MAHIRATALIGLAACSKPEPIRVDLSSAGEGIELAAIALLRDDGSPTRVSPIFGLEGGALGFGEFPFFDLDGEESRAIAIGFGYEQLRTIHPGIDPIRREEIAISPAAPPSAPVGRVSAAGALFESALPAGTVAIDGGARSELSQELRLQLRLTMPVDPEHCRVPGHELLVPFGDRAFIDPTGNGFDRVIRVDGERILLKSMHRVRVARRGDPPVHAGFDTTQKLAGLALERRAGGDLVVWTSGMDEAGSGFLLSMPLLPSGLGMTSTAAIDGPVPQLREILVQDDGGIVVAGRRGTIAVRRPGETTFRVMRGIATDETIRAIGSTGDPAWPHAATIDSDLFTGAIYEGDAFEDRWREVSPRISEQFVSFASDPANGELWGSGPLGALRRRTREGRWEGVSVCFPPSLAECGRSMTEPLCWQPNDLDRVVVDGEHAYLALERCSPVARLRRSDGCVSVMRRQGVEGTTIDDEAQTVDLDIWNGWLTVTNDDGSVYELNVSRR